ncbi:hypothetical protein FKM82_027302 [Ascaphus truei]
MERKLNLKSFFLNRTPAMQQQQPPAATQGLTKETDFIQDKDHSKMTRTTDVKRESLKIGSQQEGRSGSLRKMKHHPQDYEMGRANHNRGD